MKRRTVAMLAAAALALAVAAGAGIGRAYAYFTSYVQASGQRTIHLGDVTTIDEKYENWKKDITITNDSDSADAVYVRVKAFAGEQYPLTYEGSGWNEGEEGFWIYEGVVLPGEAAPVITVNIDGEGKVEEGKTINVIVVYETTPAIENGTDASGKTLYESADWSRGLSKTDTVAAEGGEQ